METLNTSVLNFLGQIVTRTDRLVLLSMRHNLGSPRRILLLRHYADQDGQWTHLSRGCLVIN